MKEIILVPFKLVFGVSSVLNFNFNSPRAEKTIEDIKTAKVKMNAIVKIKKFSKLYLEIYRFLRADFLSEARKLLHIWNKKKNVLNHLWLQKSMEGRSL